MNEGEITLFSLTSFSSVKFSGVILPEIKTATVQFDMLWPMPSLPDALWIPALAGSNYFVRAVKAAGRSGEMASGKAFEAGACLAAGSRHHYNGAKPQKGQTMTPPASSAAGPNLAEAGAGK